MAQAATASGKGVIDIGRVIDDAKWSVYQKSALVVAALAVILDGFDNQILSLAIPELIKQWGVTRDDFKWVLVIGFVGMAIGTALLGTLGDKIGRKPTLIGCISLFALATITIAFVSSIPPLYVLRFLGGVGLGGAMPNATALLAELTPLRRRSIGVTCGIVGIPIGGTIGGLIAAQVLPMWQNLFLIGGVMPLVIVVIMLLMLPESPRFLARRAERKGELVKTLGKMGITVDADATFVDDKTEKHVEKVSVGALFSPLYARDSIGLWGAMFFTLLSVYGVVNWLPAMLGAAKYPPSMTSNGLTFFNLGGVVTALLGAICFSKFGSRKSLITMAAGAVLSSIWLAMIPLDPKVSTLPLLTALTLQGGFINGVQTTMYALGAFIYATEIRGSGVGWAVGVGRTGAIISPLVGAALLASLGPKGFFFGIALTMTLSLISIAIIKRHVPKIA